MTCLFHATTISSVLNRRLEERQDMNEEQNRREVVDPETENIPFVPPMPEEVNLPMPANLITSEILDGMEKNCHAAPTLVSFFKKIVPVNINITPPIPPTPLLSPRSPTDYRILHEDSIKASLEQTQQKQPKQREVDPN